MEKGNKKATSSSLTLKQKGYLVIFDPHKVLVEVEHGPAGAHLYDSFQYTQLFHLLVLTALRHAPR